MRGGETSESGSTSLRPSAKSRARARAVVNKGLTGTGTPKPNPHSMSMRRSLLLSNPKPQDHPVGSPKPLTRPRRSLMPMPMPMDTRHPHSKYKELVAKVEVGESLIKTLQDQVLGLKAELERALSFNLELHSHNTNLTHDLSAAQAKLATLTAPQNNSNGEYQRPNFKDIHKLIANKLDTSKVKSITEVKLPSQRVLTTVDAQRKAPPPPPPCPPAIPPTTRKATSFQEFYQSLTKQEGKKAPALPGPVTLNKPTTTSAHNSIVGEIQNRSAHLLAVKADIATKGDFINGLIQKVHTAAYTNIEDVLKFVDWLDSELSSLADERAVLKHFKWPERKADAMREAAVEYRDLKLLENEISAFHDDTNIPCEVALKRMANLLDKSERSIQRLIKLRSSVTRSYQECKIPTDWMLDSGIVSKIKKTSMKLAKVYMNRVTMELESIRNSDRESAQEALLLQGLHFAYRAHQFAGGLDSDTMCAFEEIRQCVPGHLGGSAEPLSAITTS